jgi:uncharacterized OsmC-like protein
MSQATMTEAPTRQPMNGVNTPALFATINAVAGQRELAKFRFQSTNRWLGGTHSRNYVSTYYGAGGDREHVKEFTVDADHPAVFAAEDNAPLPVELVLCALASCITGGIATVAAARRVELYSVESTIEGDIDLQGILGLSPEFRNGFSSIRIDFKVEGDAPEETLRAIVEQSKNRSAVLDIVTNGLPVQTTVNGR